MKKLMILLIVVILFVYMDFNANRKIEQYKFAIALIENDPDLDRGEKMYRIAVIESQTVMRYDVLKSSWGKLID